MDVPALQSDSIQRFDQPPRRERLEEFVRGCAARVMHLDTDGRPGPREQFSDLGMDPLMALQLKTEIGAGLGFQGDSLPATIAFDTGTLEALTNQLLTLSLLHPVKPPARETAAGARTRSLSGKFIGRVRSRNGNLAAQRLPAAKN